MQLYITKFCNIRDNKIHVNGALMYENIERVSIKTFMSNIYITINLDYPKFFKMDNLSKVGFMSVELMLDDDTIRNYNHKPDVAVMMCNSVSSLDTDLNYNDTIIDKTNYFPSPSVFVYTLPNIMVGEIAIRHKIMGETIFTINDRFDADSFVRQINQNFESSDISAIICGWVDLLDNYCRVFTWLVEKNKISPIELSIDSLEELYDR